MPRTPLTHNPLNGVTAGVWRQGDVVHKVLTRRRPAPAHWRASDDPRHWNFWRREAHVYESGLPERLGLGAPRCLATDTTPEGDVELRLELVEGRHGADLSLDDLAAAARALGRSQGAGVVREEPWLSRGFLRAYSASRPARWALLDDDDAWAQPLVREHFDVATRRGLLRMHQRRERLLGLVEHLPRTVGHLDAWPNNIVRRAGGEVAFLDWAFTGDAGLGEDVGNLVPDSVFDLLVAPEALDELDERLTQAYLGGLEEAGWTGDPRIARLGICASAVKYDWLTARSLEQAGAAEQLDYGHGRTIDADRRFAARAAGLGLCARWTAEAERLATALGR